MRFNIFCRCTFFDERQCQYCTSTSVFFQKKQLDEIKIICCTRYILCGSKHVFTFIAIAMYGRRLLLFSFVFICYSKKIRCCSWLCKNRMLSDQLECTKLFSFRVLTRHTLSYKRNPMPIIVLDNNIIIANVKPLQSNVFFVQFSMFFLLDSSAY